jgi:hypothetical protein
MSGKAFVRVLDGQPAIYSSDSTRDRVVVRVGNQYRSLTPAEWDALPPYRG